MNSRFKILFFDKSDIPGMVRLGSIRPNNSKKISFSEDVVFGYYEDSPVYWAATESAFCSGPYLISCLEYVLTEVPGVSTDYDILIDYSSNKEVV